MFVEAGIVAGPGALQKLVPNLAGRAAEGQDFASVLAGIVMPAAELAETEGFEAGEGSDLPSAAGVPEIPARPDPLPSASQVAVLALPEDGVGPGAAVPALPGLAWLPSGDAPRDAAKADAPTLAEGPQRSGQSQPASPAMSGLETVALRPPVERSEAAGPPASTRVAPEAPSGDALPGSRGAAPAPPKPDGENLRMAEGLSAAPAGESAGPEVALAAPADPREFGRAAAAAPPAAAGETVASAPPPPSERQVPALQSTAFTADAPGARPQIPGGAVQPETSPATTGADAAGLEAGLPALAGPAREEPPKAATQGQSTQLPAPSPTMRANTAADIAAGAAVHRLEPEQALPGPAEDEAGSESDLRVPIPLDPATEARTGLEGPEVRIALPGLAEKVPDAATGPSPALSGSADPIALRETLPEGVMVAAGDPVARAPEAAPAGSAPSPSSDPGRSVAMQLAAAVTADREGGFEVRLSPEELGVVKLTLHVGDGAVTLAIQAERPETLDLLRRSVDVLEREFRDAGFTSLNLSFGHGGGDRPARGASAYSAVVLDRPDAAGTAPHPSAPHGRAPLSSQLDLRL